MSTFKIYHFNLVLWNDSTVVAPLKMQKCAFILKLGFKNYGKFLFGYASFIQVSGRAQIFWSDADPDFEES